MVHLTSDLFSFHLVMLLSNKDIGKLLKFPGLYFSGLSLTRGPELGVEARREDRACHFLCVALPEFPLSL